jgi:hypothetical protein
MSEPMIPATRLGIEVEVLVDGRWWPGTLEHWRRNGDRWEGWERLHRQPATFG